MVEVPDIRFVTEGELSLAYLDIDGGPHSLLVVPGMVSHLERNFEMFPDWANMIGRLNGFGRVVTFDKRGCGMSDRIVGAPSLEERTRDIDMVLDAVGLEAVTLLGFSEAAAIAALYAATKPERVERLVLGGGYARFTATDDYPWGLSDEEVEYLLGDYCDGWGTGVSADRYQPATPTSEDRRRWAGYERACCTPSTMRQLFGLVRDLDVREVIPVVSCPTLVISESEDRPAGATYLAEHLPDAELCLLEGRVHLPWHGTERFEEWMATIERFITGTEIGVVSLDRVLATVVFTDIVDSTATAASLGDGPWRQRLDHYEDLAEEATARFGGRVVKSTGDGTLAVFDGPARAVSYAHALADAVSSQLGIELRGGVHTGEIELRGDDVGGISVHIAARVQSTADGSQVMVTSVVEQLCLGSGLEFVPAGSHELKGVPGTWDLRRYTPH